MKKLVSKRKRIAIALLATWLIEGALPYTAFALTSGPSQPEVQSFQPATVSDMVDLSSGQLKYNIPLLDIDGYPISLNYDSGTGLDDEASWAGLGWNVNTGAITRQVRGMPDDFSGDPVETDHYVKPKITVGGKVTFKGEAFGLFSGSLTTGIFSDSYTGLGAEVGVNAGISLSTPNDGFLTAGMGLGVLSNTQSGVDASFSPYVSLGIKENTDDRVSANAGLSGSFGYNTRSGIKALTLGTSFGVSGNDLLESNTYLSYNTQPISPTITVPYATDYSSFSFDAGGEFEGFSGMVGGTGYKNVRQVKSIYNVKPGFGFLYAERGMNNQDAVMDFIRENDNPVIPNIPDIAVPIPTPDVWSYTSQSGSGQFRLYRGGSGAFFDNQSNETGKTHTLGGDLAFGAWVHFGVTYYNQNYTANSGKWTNSNSYLPNGDFQNPNYTNPNAEHVYFKEIGEKGIEDQDMDSRLGGTQAYMVATSGATALPFLRAANNRAGNPALAIPSPIAKTSRRPNRTVISYLTATEASQAGLYKSINNYAFKDSTNINSLVANQGYTPTNRVDPNTNDSNYIHKPQHISQITVTGDDGKRMVYGIPAYNVYQDDYTFAVNHARDTNNLVAVPPGISSPMGDPNGVDNYYHKEHKPAYATSYLLSAILSPDYVDRTGDGITDDDAGTAIKFNYSKLPYYYKWRTPYARAASNRGLLADADDDKGSIIYGKKEVWYIQSIETKTKIAFFITESRRDAVGVGAWQNGGIDPSNTLKCLQQIRLYSKADMSKPIKVIKFQYTYELCTNVPNSLDHGSANHKLGGKLTLSRVWFEYGNSDKGKYHPYIFRYNELTAKYNGTTTPLYKYNSTDRWGIYRPASQNQNLLDNEMYPYTNQDTSYTNQSSALWHLNQITLPTGGVINISYESGDYAYVQNQKAMVMTPIESLITSTGDGDHSYLPLNSMNGIRVNIGTSLVPPSGANQTTWFENNFLNGSSYLYTKMYVNMATPNFTDTTAISRRLTCDMVPTYCQIQSVSISSGKASIMLTPISAGGVTKNPVSICAWQRLKNEYPRYAYPGFDTRVQTNSNSVLTAVTQIVNAARNMKELLNGFYDQANRSSYAIADSIQKSFVKLVAIGGHKLGGPARVKMIQISDTWTNNGTPNASIYGQSYTYTTTVSGQTVSSGVASYEPSIGNDENALKQPVPYVQNIKGAINNYFDLEMPFCESLFPAPGITYSKVTVNDLDQHQLPSTQTGSIVNEFYTTKDFPTVVTTIQPQVYTPTTGTTYSLMYSSSSTQFCISQGYSIELNDMNGKQKAVTVYDQGGAVISATNYVYNTQTDANGNTLLNNRVNVINPGTLQQSTAVLGRDVDFFTDFREQGSSNTGQAVNVGGDVFPLSFFLPFFPVPHFPKHDDNDVKLFRSACAIKVIQDYGILSKVIKTENGSTITTQNLAYDALTGDPVVTRTNNEYQRPLYNVNIPAYWVYNGMSGAYQNQGVMFSGFTTNANGEIAAYGSYLHAGDEIFDTQNGIHYWVVYNQAASGSGNTFKLIDINGNIQPSYTAAALVKVVRSGYRNMLTANTTTIVCMNSPFTSDGHLQLINSSDLTSLKVINASATTYSEGWSGAGNVCQKVVEYFDHNYYITKGDTDSKYGLSGMIITSTSGVKYSTDSVSVLNAALNRCGIWVGPSEDYDNYQLSTWLGLEACLNVPATQTYYFGFAADNGTKIYIDNVAIDSTSNNSPPSPNANFYYWYVRPHTLTAGQHDIKITFINNGLEASAGLEIYNNTYSQLVNPDLTLAGLHRIFRTDSLISTRTQSFIPESSGSISYRYRYSDGTIPHVPCTPGIYTTTINPHIDGYLGNWRPYQTKVFQQSRNYAFAGNLNALAVDARDAGYVNSFYSYWYNNAGTWTVNPNGSRWVTANTVTLYDKYGQQLENKDALGRFSAANFDFNGELPSAVASNAMNREIYAASLEDSYFIFGKSNNPDTCNIREFKQPSTSKTIKQLAVNTLAHSGNYCALLPTDGVTLSTIIDTVHQKSIAYFTLDATKQYIPGNVTGLYPNGFEPYPGKKYMFDAWVNDGNPNDKTIRAALSINGNNVPLKCKAVVEGWKLLEGTMDLSTLGSATTLNISIVPTISTVYIDDIRMFPFDSQIKTYAYDAATLRLMAELDENGFATFYEYDDEGLLVRVKKETERGIMTIKESRSTYRRNTH